MHFRPLRLGAAAVVLPLFLSGCGGSADGPSSTPSTPTTPITPTAPGPVATVTVTAGNGQSMTVGATSQWTAAAKDNAGLAVTGKTFTWTTSDVAKATVSSTGLVTTIFPGNVNISATTDGVTGSSVLAISAPILKQVDGTGPAGSLGVNVDDSPFRDTHAYGFSYYTAITTVNPSSAAATQLGWGVWIEPNNLSFTQPLCPVGTTSRDQFTDRAASFYRDVYQTMEGGAGYWGNVQFPTTTSKFLIGGTPNCYSNGVSPGGYQMNVSVTPDSLVDIAQLSNRLLVPPDRLVFSPSAPSTFLGYGWLALPLIPAHTSAAGMPVGDQSWTLFLNTTNFKGPVAFWVPDAWTTVHAVDHTGAGRSMDARPALAIGLDLELCCSPAFEAKDSAGTTWRRVPPEQFPADANRRAFLMQDTKMYSKTALWDAVNTWVQGGAPAAGINASGVASPGMKDAHTLTTMNGSAKNVDYDTLFSAVAGKTSGGGDAFTLKWAANMTAGTLPEYFKLVNGTWKAVPASDVPRTTWLADQSFRKTVRGSVAALSTSGVSWTSAKWAAGPFTVSLSDGSSVDYVWYKFVDQPAIRRLGLSAAVLAQVQTWVESLHAASGVNGLTIAAPSAGTLTTLDPALIVTPPAGFEKGYVPIVIKQY